MAKDIVKRYEAYMKRNQVLKTLSLASRSGDQYAAQQLLVEMSKGAPEESDLLKDAIDEIKLLRKKLGCQM